MKYKIGVFGSGGAGKPKDEVKAIAREVGKLLGEHADEVIVITGGCSGLPYEAAYEAAQKGAEVWGYSPVYDEAEQKEFTPDDDLSIYTKLVYVSRDMPFADNRRIRMKYRNVLSTAECDAGIVISGQWGSLNEFTNLVDMQKIAAVLTGTGGVADELPALARKIVKEGQGAVIFNDDPQKLVQELFKLLRGSRQ